MPASEVCYRMSAHVKTPLLSKNVYLDVALKSHHPEFRRAVHQLKVINENILIRYN